MFLPGFSIQILYGLLNQQYFALLKVDGVEFTEFFYIGRNDWL